MGKLRIRHRNLPLPQGLEEQRNTLKAEFEGFAAKLAAGKAADVRNLRVIVSHQSCLVFAADRSEMSECRPLQAFSGKGHKA